MTEICCKCRVAVNPNMQKKVIIDAARVMHDFCYAQHLYDLSMRVNNGRRPPCVKDVAGVGKLSKTRMWLRRRTA